MITHWIVKKKQEITTGYKDVLNWAVSIFRSWSGPVQLLNWFDSLQFEYPKEQHSGNAFSIKAVLWVTVFSYK